MNDYIKTILIERTKDQLADSDIRNVEKELNIKFPEDYKQHLLKHNGGHPIKNRYPMIECIDNDPNNNTADIDWFLAIYDGEYDNFLKDYNTFKIWQKRMPDELIPIGCGSGGDQICISVKGNNYGKVYFWNHDWECEEGEEPDYSNVHLIANSFTEFINSLYQSDVEKDIDGKWIYISIHDKYSLPVYTETKKYEPVIKEFFDKAPKEVEDFIIKKFVSNGNLLLLFQSGTKEYFRRINKEENIVEEDNNSIHTKNPDKNEKNKDQC